VIKPQTYDIQPQGYCLRHTTESANLDQHELPIDSLEQQCDRLFLLVPVADVLVPGLSGQPAEHLSLARGRCRSRRGLARLVHDRRLDSDVVRRLASQDRATTVEEDIHLVESVQRGLKSRGYVPGPLVIDPKCGLNSEHSILPCNAGCGRPSMAEIDCRLLAKLSSTAPGSMAARAGSVVDPRDRRSPGRAGARRCAAMWTGPWPPPAPATCRRAVALRPVERGRMVQAMGDYLLEHRRDRPLS
jgi:hypothetical protein